MTARIDEPMVIGGVAVRNRLYRAPVLEGAGRAKDPAGEYAKHFVPNAKAGVGLIVQGNTIVLPEGRTSPGMSGITGREQVLALAPMVRQVHEAGARIAVQLGHGGAYSLESWHREFVAARTHLPFAPGRLPFPQRWFHGGVHVMTTGEVEALAARFGVVAAWAREAGYDAVQLAGSNAKLLHLFLSRRYNRRDDKYGGSLENRFRLIAEIRAAIAREAGEDFPVWLKFPACEGRGISRTEGITIARLAEDAGFSALTPVIA
ncbi:NADH:flavin oxidoreductase, partial [bacterium]|nr:NADH:flavin oxidoreductase [bacterium]